MSFFAKNKKDAGELTLVFDIGSSSVGGALFLRQSSGVPKIIYAVREQIRIEETVDIQKLLQDTMQAVKKVAGLMCLQGLGRPSSIYCVLSSPWYASQTRTVVLEKNAPFIFNDKLADSLIQKELKLFEDEHALKYNQTSNSIKSLEMRTMSTVLNGYVTTKPFGQKAEDLELTMFISMAESGFLKEIESSISRHFHEAKIEFITFILSSFVVARDMFVNKESFLLVNIGGEITDISMIKKDILREAISFPMGRNYIIRGVSKGMSCSIEDARSFISLYKEGHMSDELLHKMDLVMMALKTEWLKKFQESISIITTDISIPATVFITVDQDLSDFFSHTIKTEQFNQYTLTESKFRVLFLGTESLHGIAVLDDKTIRDPFLIIESIYINEFLK